MNVIMMNLNAYEHPYGTASEINYSKITEFNQQQVSHNNLN